MSIKHEATVPTDAAIWAAIIMLVIIIVLITFFCCMPIYRTMQRRWKHWDDPENDPRWEGETFQFSPTSPRMDRLELPVGARTLPKYNRLSTSSSYSLSSSFKSHPMDRQPDAACQMPRYPDQIEIELPPKYADIFKLAEEEESVGTPQLYHSRSPSEEKIENKIKTEINHKNISKLQNKNQIRKVVKEPKLTTPKQLNIENENKNSSMKENTDTKLNIKSKPVMQSELNKKIKEGTDKKETLAKTNAQAKLSTLNEGHKNEPKNNQKFFSKSTSIENEVKSTPKANPPKSYRKLKKNDLKVAVSTANSNSNSLKETNNEQK